MTNPTRHGVETDEEREYFEALPEDEQQEARRKWRQMTERSRWVGRDWPKPSKNGKADSVAIVGFAPSRLLAPYGEDGWELWSLNDPHEEPGIPARHAFTRWFQIHPPRYLAEHWPQGLGDLALHWGDRTGVRLYMDRHYPEYPDSEPYPVEGVRALTPHGFFHASSFDWMVALAIHEGFKRIDVYGCEFYAYPARNREPLSALPCLSYWCGVAEGRGIELNVIGGGHLFKIVHMAVYESGLQYGWDREPALDLGTKGSAPDRAWRDLR